MRENFGLGEESKTIETTISVSIQEPFLLKGPDSSSVSKMAEVRRMPDGTLGISYELIGINGRSFTKNESEHILVFRSIVETGDGSDQNPYKFPDVLLGSEQGYREIINIIDLQFAITQKMVYFVAEDGKLSGSKPLSS